MYSCRDMLCQYIGYYRTDAYSVKYQFFDPITLVMNLKIPD